VPATVFFGRCEVVVVVLTECQALVETSSAMHARLESTPVQHQRCWCTAPAADTDTLNVGRTAICFVSANMCVFVRAARPFLPEPNRQVWAQG
jgi:hypothetical protein